MKTVRSVAVAFILGMIWSSNAFGQSHSHHEPILDSASVAIFVGEIRSAIARFQDRNEAVAAGYRQIGPDFPGMGEHWVQPREIVRRSVNPRQPSVLSYVVLNGEPLLTGAAYALPVANGEDPPDLPFGNVWHVHEGTVAEETLVLNPRVGLRGTKSEYSLAMFHVWTELENPDGIFAQDNWTLPFVRLGLEVPETVTPAAGKAAFLINGGDEYYLNLLVVAANPDEDELARFKAILGASAEEARSIVKNSTGVSVVAPLEAVWYRLWEQLEMASSQRTWGLLEELGR